MRSRPHDLPPVLHRIPAPLLLVRETNPNRDNTRLHERNTMSDWIEQITPTRVAKTNIGPVFVSTVILYSGFADERQAETMIFIDEGTEVPGLTDQDGERCYEGGAQEQHDEWCAKVRAALLDPTP